MLLLSSSGEAFEGTGPLILTISVVGGGTATNDIDIELNVVLDEGKKLFDELRCADTIPMYGASQAIRQCCDYIHVAILILIKPGNEASYSAVFPAPDICIAEH